MTSLPLLAPTRGALGGPRACSPPLWLLSPDPALTRNLSHAGTRHWSSPRSHGCPSIQAPLPDSSPPSAHTAQGKNLSCPCPERRLQTLPLIRCPPGGHFSGPSCSAGQQHGTPSPSLTRVLREARTPLSLLPAPAFSPLRWPMADGWPVSISHTPTLTFHSKAPSCCFPLNKWPPPEVKTLATPTLPSSPSANPTWPQPPASALPPWSALSTAARDLGGRPWDRVPPPSERLECGALLVTPEAALSAGTVVGKGVTHGPLHGRRGAVPSHCSLTGG